MNLKTICLGILCSLTLLAEPSALPVPCSAGNIVAFATTEAPQRFVDFELAAQAAAAKNHSGQRIGGEELTRTMECGEGNLFVVMTVQLTEGRSITKFDWALRTDAGTVIHCREIGKANESFFDFRLTDLRGPNSVRLIFVCPKDVRHVSLISAFQELPFPPAGLFQISEDHAENTQSSVSQ